MSATSTGGLATTRFGSGKAVRRLEDPALVRGQGRYTDDLAPAELPDSIRAGHDQMLQVYVPVFEDRSMALTNEPRVVGVAEVVLDQTPVVRATSDAVQTIALVTTLGLAEREGLRITFREFMRTGVPVMVGSLLIGSVYLASFVFLGAHRAPIVMGSLAVLGFVLVWRTEVA